MVANTTRDYLYGQVHFHKLAVQNVLMIIFQDRRNYNRTKVSTNLPLYELVVFAAFEEAASTGSAVLTT